MERTPTYNLKEYRQKIADLYAKGYSVVVIAKMLEKERTTILHHLKEMGLKIIKPKITQIDIKKEPEKYTPMLILKEQETILPNKEQNIKEETLNEGKNYAEYLIEDKEKRYAQLLKGNVV